jgi:serine protease Do
MRIDPDCPSYEAGLREGDIIQEINRKPVRDADEAVRMSENVKNDAVLLKVWGRGGSRYLVVKQKN